MDLAGISTLLSVPAAVIVAVIVAARERSDLRWIERLMALDKREVHDPEVREALSDLQGEVLANALRKRQYAAGMRYSRVGLAVALLGLFAVQVIAVLHLNGPEWLFVGAALVFVTAFGAVFTLVGVLSSRATARERRLREEQKDFIRRQNMPVTQGGAE